jgi:hypothetical protein
VQKKSPETMPCPCKFRANFKQAEVDNRAKAFIFEGILNNSWKISTKYS